ncbi:MAG: L-lactate dehydrogenase [Promethearchaeota archaeon]|jgi:L-lactate dehydrogenase|nr:MAG: L-lactate dehydrogenase [Candidatus Lokiarchaeota archaeon]
MSKITSKISIIGCGNVGMAFAYAAIIKAIAREFVLVDIDMERIKGEVMDLNHTAPFTKTINIKAGEYSDIKNSDLVVITAGKNQEPGQTRLDIAQGNVDLFKKIIPKIYKYAPDAIYLVVSNPVDILSYAAYKISGKEHREIIGSGTTLDTARLRFKLSEHCEVDPRNVHAYILGEHGDTEFPVWSRALIGGLLFDDYCHLCFKRDLCDREEQIDAIFTQVKNSAYKIIDKKRETSYGIGLSLVRISQAIINDENAILPVSCLISDYLGIDDVFLSLPRVLNKKGVRETLKLKLNKEEEKDLKHSADTLKDVLDSVRF